MPRNAKILRSIDQPNPHAPLAPAPSESADDLAPPLSPSALEPPENLVLTAALARSAGTPTALISATWDAPAGVVVDKYTVQWSTNSTFPAADTYAADTVYNGATIPGLHTSTLYYVRVSAWEHGVQSQWSSMTPLTTGVNRITTPADTVAPAPPTGAAGVFVNAGDLLITWTEPSLLTSPNFRDVEVTIWDSAAKAITYLTDYSATGQYVFTAAMNGQATSYAYDPSLYIELRSRSWGNQFSVPVVLGTITKAVPATPTGLTTTWDAAVGSLIFDWSDVVGANGYTLTLDGKVYPVATSKFVYDVARNRNDHGGTPDPAIAYSLRAVDALLQVSAAVSATSTLAPPATPSGLTSSWASDAGLAGPDCTLSWNSQAAIAGFKIDIDGKVRNMTAQRYTYVFDTNRADHSGTADTDLTVQLWAVDGLGQQSTTPASLNPVNVAPPSCAVTLNAGFSALAITIVQSAAADFLRYTVRVQKDGVDVATYTTVAPDTMAKTSGRGVYQVFVKVEDAFGQLSTETSSLTVFIDAVTNDEIRADAIYTDSIGTDFTTLPNKVILKDDATGAGITYAASASAWRWTQLERPLTERGRRVSVKLGSGAANFYIGASVDGTTWRWFAGVGGDGYSLTERASEAIAQTNASLASALSYGWAELPATVEFRFITLGHRNTTTSYRLDEFYAYTLIIADMIRAGDIQGIHIAAATIAADKITATFTITGKNIQTATSGARVVLSGDTNGGMVGYSASDTYNTSTGAGTYQVLWQKTSGRFFAGAGVLSLDADGATIRAATTINDLRSYKFDNSGGNVIGGLYGYAPTGSLYVLSLTGKVVTGHDSNILISADTPSTSTQSDITLLAGRNNSSSTTLVELQNLNSGTGRRVLVSCNYTHIDGALNVGFGVTITATNGAIRAEGTITSETAVAVDVTTATTAAVVGAMTMLARSSGTPAAGFGTAFSFQAEVSNHTARTQAQFYGEWIDATDASRQGRLRIIAVDSVSGREVLRAGANGSAGTLGFFGSAGVARPAVTGVRTGTLAQLQAVVGNLLGALAVGSLGLITDNTT